MYVYVRTNDEQSASARYITREMRSIMGRARAEYDGISSA